MSAAIVVIMIGRKRTLRRLDDRLRRRRAFRCARASIAKSIIMIAFFFTMPIEQDDADERVDARARCSKIEQREQRAERRERQTERIVIGWMKLSYSTPSTM